MKRILGVFIYIAGEEQNTREGEERERAAPTPLFCLPARRIILLATGIYHADPQLRQL